MYEAIHRLVEYVSVRVEYGKRLWTVFELNNKISPLIISILR